MTEALKTRYGEQVKFVTLTVGEGNTARLAQEWQVRGTPTYVIFDASKKEIGRVVGSGHTVEDFDAHLAKVNIAPVKTGQ